MPDYPVIKAKKRKERGKRSMRRLRSEGFVPAVIYGRGFEPQPLSLDGGQVREVVESRAKMVEVRIGSKSQPAVIKEVQFDHLDSDIQHVDFETINLAEAIRIEVPVETHGTARGVRNGGVLEITHKHITVECKPADVPREVVVEVADLDVGSTITVGQITVGEGVRVLDDPEIVAIAIHAPRKAEEVEVAPLEEEMAQPEVIGAKGAEEGPEEGEED